MIKVSLYNLFRGTWNNRIRNERKRNWEI